MSPDSSAPMFAPREKDPKSTNVVAWAVATGVIALVLAGILLLTHTNAASNKKVEPLDPYAASLVFSDVQMSESSSLSGLKATFIDGHVRNAGSRRVTSVTLQVIFANDLKMPPQIEPVSLNLIRTHEPYIDTQPVSAAPLNPGDTREFRLAFENISSDWNQSLPELRPTRITTK